MLVLIGPMGHAGPRLRRRFQPLSTAPYSWSSQVSGSKVRGKEDSKFRCQGDSSISRNDGRTLSIIRYSSLRDVNGIGRSCSDIRWAGILTYAVSAMAARSDELVFLKGILLRRKGR